MNQKELNRVREGGGKKEEKGKEDEKEGKCEREEWKGEGGELIILHNCSTHIR